MIGSTPNCHGGEAAIFPGSRRAAGDTAVTGVATAPQVNQAGAGDTGDVGADTEPLAATRRFTQFAGRPITDFTQPLRVPQNLVDLSGSGSRAARQLGDLAIELIRAGRTWLQRLLAWAAERPVAPNSVTGIAFLAALCAAAWFSGGSAGDDLRGFLAVAVWALARVCARQLAAATAQRESARPKPATGKGGQASKRPRLPISTAAARTAPGRTGSGRTGSSRTGSGHTGPDYAAPGGTDWLVLPAFNWTPDHPEPTADRRWPTAPPFRRAQATAEPSTSASDPTAPAATAEPVGASATSASAATAPAETATAEPVGPSPTSASAPTASAETATAATAAAPTAAGGTTAQMTDSVRKFAWLASVCTRAAECAIYGGIAAGAVAAGWQGTWSFAIVIVIFVCAADIAQTCSRAVAARSPKAAPAASAVITAPPQAPPPQAPPPQAPPSQARAARARLAAALTVPAGARVLLAAFLLVVYSPRMALFAVLVITILSLIRSIVRAARAWRETRSAASAPASPKTVLATATAGQDVVLACRDDGALARWTGRWLLGNLMPLPPAIAGLTAILLLGWVGMRQLPGVVAFTPIVVLLLAAPGSSHPHDGRLDWLVPAVLCFGQFSFLAALGPARSVPYPIVFAACSMTAIWYAGLVAGLNYPAGPATQPRPVRATAGAAGPTPVLASRKQRIKQIIARKQPPGMHRIGWEGRVCFIALAGMFGLTTFGYLGLSVCLAALIGRNALVNYLKPAQEPKPGEEQRL
ncbi:MAG TPA: hypothetical protein VFI65_04915 [Streptosporangiaceae bacterium]|nr:hypothetical protein [Streptosporangiaceae bacterium]